MRGGEGTPAVHRDSLHHLAQESAHFGWDNSIAPVLEIDSGEVFPYNRLPFLVLAWLAIGLLVVLLAPGLAKRLGEGLSRREGLSEAAEAAPEAGT
jgi:hypothetical protein